MSLREFHVNGHSKKTTPDNEASHVRFPDEPTSHSTSLLKDSNQVAGYLPNPLMEQPAIRPGLQKTAAKSLAIP